MKSLFALSLRWMRPRESRCEVLVPLVERGVVSLLRVLGEVTRADFCEPGELRV